MSAVVMKFGGASVATPASFRRVASIVCARAEEFKRIVVVVSAMGEMTDTLLELAHSIHPHPPRRERDMLITAGERISIALLAMALAKEGKEAISFTGSQSGIITCSSHGDAKIVDVRPIRIREALDKEKIVIVAGFQGVSLDKEITTLGRGGSDTTAVALGIALGADRVEFYKDVEGVFSDDPKVVPDAQLYPHLSFEQAFEVAARGAFLSPRSILLASKNNLPLHVRSFRTSDSGTVVGETSGSIREKVFE